jgi:phytoene synthase
MTNSLEHSYAYCRSVARRRARNFYYSFLALPRPERNAVCAIYSFMRYCDDLSDEPGADVAVARARIEQWRADLDSALCGNYSQHLVWPAFHDVVQRYRIPSSYFHEMIDGVASDLDRTRFNTFGELYRYCYQVASVAGLSVIHIFGFDSADALLLAEKCGIAFQLTNILRDIREDALRGRIYLPVEDLERFAVSPNELLNGQKTDRFVQLMRYEAERAARYYAESAPLLDLVHPRNRSSLLALIQIYRRLLERIERSNFDVLQQRISLPAWEKSWIVMRVVLHIGETA